MMLAWFRRSLKTASSEPTSAETTPTLARKPLPNTSAASVPWKSASRSSSALVAASVPTIRREAVAPAPRAAARAAASRTAGCEARPR